MSEGRDVGGAAKWLGTKAVDGARVGPFELVSCDREGARVDTFDVYVDGFDEPLAFGVFAAEADSLTRRFVSSVAACDATLRAMQHTSLPPASSRRSSSRRSSKRKGSRHEWRSLRATLVTLVLGVLAALLCGYYFANANPPDATALPPAPE